MMQRKESFNKTCPRDGSTRQKKYAKSTIEAVEKEMIYVQTLKDTRTTSDVFIINSEHISHIFVACLLLTLNR